MSALRIFPIAAVGFLLALGFSGCREDGKSGKSREPRSSGFVLHEASGLAHYQENLFVVVHDTDRRPTSPRLGIVAMKKKSQPKYRPLDVDWTRVGRVPDDLESICSVPGRSNEFLVVESGGADERPARIIRLRLTGLRRKDVRAQVVGKIDLPDEIHNLEGSALIPGPDGGLLLVLCERDERKAAAADNHGVVTDRHTLLLWAGIDLDAYRLEIPFYRTMVRAGAWPSGKRLRTCSDLFYDGEAESGPLLWIAATSDPGAVGPFDSIIYRVPIEPHDLARPDGLTMQAAWRVDGLKVEGLADPWLAGSGLTMLTDGDALGGVIRALPAPTLPDS